jgi:deoxyribodipyrimidine photo-lyase
VSTREKVVLFWFRRDLRLHDNAGLYYALQEKEPVLPLFIFDENILSGLDEKRDPRVQFIHDQVTELHRRLRDLGSGILVRYGTPEAVFRELAGRYRISAVYTNRDYEPYARERDNQIRKMLGEAGIRFHAFKDHVIFEKTEICTDKGEPYRVFTPYKNRWLGAWRSAQIQAFPSEAFAERFLRCDPFVMPGLAEIGFGISPIPIPPCRLDAKRVEQYHLNRDFPALEGTTRLGIHLRHGTMSIREAALKAADLSETWLNELIWRDFYSMVMYNFPHVVTHAFRAPYDRIPWRNDRGEFARWCNGTTGYPIVDAGMRELNHTGYMHNRVRMITASFLSKHLLIDWRWGEAYFAGRLLDYELASNNGGWQWAAGTGTDAQPYFRVFNPEAQTAKFDPGHAYIRKWIPELGSSRYPAPMIDHKFARERAIRTFKAALS